MPCFGYVSLDNGCEVLTHISGKIKHDYHSYDILGAGMLWKPKEARILTNFIDQPVNIGKHLRTKNVLTRCFTKNFQEF